MLEFLVSLKYYSKIWPRALMFAHLAGIIQYKSSNVDPNFNYAFDLFTQNYFLYCYAKIVKYEKFLKEHLEGNTWLLKDKVEDIINDMLVFSNSTSKKKVLLKA